MRRTALATVAAAWLLGASVSFALAPAECWTLRKHGHGAEAQACFERLTRSGEAEARAEGFWGLEQWEQANEQFRLAAGSAGGAAETAETKVRWGMLLHERFNDAEAATLMQEALQSNPKNAEAYVGLGVISADGFDGKAMAYAEKAIALDPKRADAHELKARLALENDDEATALTEADRAIALEDDALDALALHAAVELIHDRPADGWFSKLAVINPGYGEAYAEVAHELELHYRYQDAVTYDRRAIAASPQLWSAHSALGIELMRLGQREEPLKELELSYDHGYRDAATVNSLRLLDSLKNFETFRDATTMLMLNRSEAALLEPYMQPELHTIVATYGKKYGMTLPGPVQVEVYPNHEDFAVRTLGMPGLGALGVTFGEVVAMDSPSGRKPGDFNWGATLWHEMSHVYILTATQGRVPRWFTEGLAVHEEGERSAAWSNRVTPEVLAAIRDKKLLPVAKLDRGFVYPEYPSQVIVSYFQAGSICDFVKATWGEGKLLAMVHSYAERKTTPEAIQADLGMTPEAFDAAYAAWLTARYGAEAEHFDAWRGKLKALAAAAQTKQYEAVRAGAAEVIALYPEYVGEANAYELLAEAARAQGDTAAEAKALAAYAKEGGESPELLKRLAALEEKAGDRAGAIATLESVNYIYPVHDEELHQRLGGLLLADKQYDAAVREYGAAVASQPVDKAGAEFHLAQAYLAAGQRDKAEDSLLAALEIAPGYRDAQKMLLELKQGPQP